MTRPDGRRSTPVVASTRPRRGLLDDLLTQAGLDVRHIPLIEIADAADPEGLATVLDNLDSFEWLVVTSQHGAERVGAAAAKSQQTKLAAVGTATAAILGRLAGREIDLVPVQQRAKSLAEVFPEPTATGRVLIAQADRADDALARSLAHVGFEVHSVVAYSTRVRRPTEAELNELRDVDAVAFASGSAAVAWSEAVGTHVPPIVVAIGPTTANTASEVGLQVTHVSTDHSVPGLAAAVIDAIHRDHRG